MKRYFNNLIGNASIKERLSGDIECGRVSHAFILEGEEGSGRHTLARQLAAALSCDAQGDIVPCGKCADCQRILASKSPDVINLGLVDDKVTIGIDTARFIKGDINITPHSLPIKMYIIEDADKMTVQAQNALLLSLEEPPEYVIFVLLCSDSSALLETIRSRAPLLRLGRISNAEIGKYLLENYKKAREIRDGSYDEFEELIISSRGTVGKAISLLDDRERRRVFSERAIAKEFIELSLSRSKIRLFDMMASLGKKRAEICSRLTTVKCALRDLILLKKADSPELVFYSNTDEACELSARFTLERLMDMYSAINTAIDDLRANSNVRLTLLSMIYSCRLAD